MSTTKTTTPLRTVVKEAFEKHVDRLESNDWDTSYRDLGIDSLGHVELTMDIEKELNINIPDDVAAELMSPNQFLKYLEAR